MFKSLLLLQHINAVLVAHWTLAVFRDFHFSKIQI